MSENEKDENPLIESQENVEQSDVRFGAHEMGKQVQKEIDEINDLLEKEKQKSLRLLADYQNLEKQTIERINARGDKIILDFLTVYEDFIRAKNVYEKDGINVEGLNVIIKNIESILAVSYTHLTLPTILLV